MIRVGAMVILRVLQNKTWPGEHTDWSIFIWEYESIAASSSLEHSVREGPDLEHNWRPECSPRRQHLYSYGLASG